MESYTTPAEARRRAVRGLLIALGYGRLNMETVVRHVDSHGSAETCLNVRQIHRAIVGRLVARHNAANAPAAFWSDETDADRWAPTPDNGLAYRLVSRKAAMPCV